MLLLTFESLNAAQLEMHSIGSTLSIQNVHLSFLKPVSRVPVPQQQGSRWIASIFANADDSGRKLDGVLASMLSKAEVMVLNFYQEGYISQRRGQAHLNR